MSVVKDNDKTGFRPSATESEDRDLGIYEDDDAKGEDLTDVDEGKINRKKHESLLGQDILMLNKVTDNGDENNDQKGPVNKNLQSENKLETEINGKGSSSVQKRMAPVATIVDTTGKDDHTKKKSAKYINGEVIRVSIAGKVNSTLERAFNSKNDGIVKKQPSISAKIMDVVANENNDHATDKVADISINRTEMYSQAGLHGTLASPASMAVTDWSELRDLRELESRIGVGSRQATRPLFSRASDQSSVTRSSSRGPETPRYFYISQDKPIPMPPLKAWCGYSGNIYFEPIKIRKTHDSKFGNVNQHSIESRSVSSKKRSSYNSRTLQNRQLAVLDRNSVMERNNPRLDEDLQWIDGLQAPGSLRVEPMRKKKFIYNKERIYKGSVAKTMIKTNSGLSLLSVNGGKYTHNVNQTLGLQSPYSLPSPRGHYLTPNSPDNTLPPLEKLQLSLRHIEYKTGKETILHIIPPGERLKYQTTSTSIQKPFSVTGKRNGSEILSTDRSSTVGI